MDSDNLGVVQLNLEADKVIVIYKSTDLIGATVRLLEFYMHEFYPILLVVCTLA